MKPQPIPPNLDALMRAWVQAWLRAPGEQSDMLAAVDRLHGVATRLETLVTTLSGREVGARVQASLPSAPPFYYWRIAKVKEITGYSRSSIWKMCAEGTFPKAAKLGGKSTAWVSTEVIVWMEERARARNSSS